MTTRLSQRRVRSSDPAYESLLQELAARIRDSGSGGYVIPAGGIPRSDMTTDVQTALALAESSYSMPAGGIPKTDLATEIQASLDKAESAYQKPVGGIGINDLESSIQQRLTDFSNFYVYPTGGIPYVDLDENLKGIIDEARMAYVPPITGIPMSDLDAESQDLMSKAKTAYQKPTTGIPLSDLAESVARKSELNSVADQLAAHANDQNRHITDHTKLTNIGVHSHKEIDDMLIGHRDAIKDIRDEIIKARDGFYDLDNRISSSLFKPNQVLIEKTEFLKGTLDNLSLSEDENIGFPFDPTLFRVRFYDMRTTRGYEQSNMFMEQNVDRLQFQWGSVIGTVNNADLCKNVGLMIDGFFYAPLTGEYRFGIQASGTYTLVVNASTLQADYHPSTVVYADQDLAKTMNVTLTGGQIYRFTLFGENLVTTKADFELLIKRPDKPFFEIMESYLYSNTGFTPEKIGVYTSHVIDTKELNIVQWAVRLATDWEYWGNEISIQVRLSDDGIVFGEWQDYIEGTDIKETPQRFVQIRVTMKRNTLDKSPVLLKVMLDYLCTKNSFFQEVADARGPFVSLLDHFRDVRDVANYAVDIASAIHHVPVDPSWLEHLRFEHLDINMMRLHWYQMQKNQEPVHLLPSGFVDDYNTLDHMDSNFSPIEVRDSKLYPLPQRPTWDTDADWMTWDRRNCSPENGSLKLTFIANDQMTGPAIETSAEFITGVSNAVIGSTYASSINFYQPFYVPANASKITEIYTWVLASSGYYASATTSYVLYPAKDDGLPDRTKGISLGSRGSSHDTQAGYWVTFPVDILIPSGKRKWFLEITLSTGYQTSGGFRAINRTSLAGVPALFAGDNPENKPLYLINRTYDTVSNYFYPIRVKTYKGYHTEGTAETILDCRVPTNFVNHEIDADLKDGIIEFGYQSSDDGVNYSPDVPVDNPLKVPIGRYLKTKIRLARTTSNQTPELRRLTIRHQPSKFITQTKPVNVGRIPTHAIIDVIDSRNNDIQYFISRDGGANFMPITPGVQTDLRSLPAGMDMIVRMESDWEKQDDNIWVEYLGMTAITHENFSPSTIVSMHHVAIAQPGQTEFALPKAYPVGDHSLQVFIDGSMQEAGISYEETNATTVTFLQPMSGGEYVVFRVAAGAYEFGDAGNLFTEIQRMESESKERDNSLDIRMAEAETKLTDHQDDLTELHGHVTRIDTHLSTIDSALSGLESADQTIQQDLTSLRDLITQIQGELEEIRVSVFVQTTDFNLLKDRVSAVEGKVQTLETSVAELVTKVTTMNQNIDNLNTRLTTAEGQLPSMTQDVDTLKTQMSDALSRISVVETTAGQLDADLSAVELSVTNLQTDMSAVQGDVTSLQSRVTTAEGSITSLDQRVTALENQTP